MKVSNRCWFVATSIFLSLAILSSQRPAEAGYISNNLGVSNSYSPYSGYTVSGPNASNGLGYGLAVEFQVAGSSSVAFGSAQLALQYRNGTNALTILLEADKDGLPGTILETLQVSNIPTAPALVTATSLANPILTAGTNYWLVALASNDTYMSWMANTQGQSDHLAYRTDTGSGPSAWSNISGVADPAFSINAVVPTPPSVALFGIGIATFAGSQVRRRTASRRS